MSSIQKDDLDIMGLESKLADLLDPHIPKNDVDLLIEKHGSIFPEDWDRDDLINFCCRWVIANIVDVEEFFSD